MDSGDDEVGIASSVQGETEGGNISAATTPDHHQAVEKKREVAEARASKADMTNGEPRGLNLKGPRLLDLLTKTPVVGASERNPIDLEPTSVIDLPDTESEDEGPEILPIHQSCTKNDETSALKEPEVSRHNYFVPSVSSDKNVMDVDNNHQKKRTILETQAKVDKKFAVTRELSLEPAAASTAGAPDGFDSEDDDGFDYDEEFPDFDMEESEIPYDKALAHNIHSPCSGASKAEALPFDKTQAFYQAANKESYTSAPFALFSMSGPINVSQPPKYIFNEVPPTLTQRAPSPSDAALARKAHESAPTLSRGILNSFPQSPYATSNENLPPGPTARPVDKGPSRLEHTTFVSYPELISPEPRSKPYDQGPFSSQSSALSPAGSPTLENRQHPSKKSAVTYARSSMINDKTAIDHTSVALGGPASKITIPSLVENYVEEKPWGSFKRKADKMSSSNDEKNQIATTKLRTFAHGKFVPQVSRASPSRLSSSAHPSTGSRLKDDATRYQWQPPVNTSTRESPSVSPHQAENQDPESILPDAQARDVPPHILEAPLSQDSVSESPSNSALTTVATQDVDEEGPARKKAKISSSTTGGIGKFVMGVGFGLAGAVAAFFATIPASVYEEARREIAQSV